MAEVLTFGGLFSGSATVTPDYAVLWGDIAVEVTGPCFSTSSNIVCKFGAHTVAGQMVDSTKAICVAPMAAYLGRITFEVSTDDGNTYTHTGSFVYGK